jgi:hypothetical protein
VSYGEGEPKVRTKVRILAGQKDGDDSSRRRRSSSVAICRSDRCGAESRPDQLHSIDRMNISKKEIVLVALVVVMAGLYVFYFTDWFRPKFIRIEYTVRSLREAWGGGGRRVDLASKQPNNVTFSLHKDYRLTSVEVVSVAEAETNKYPHALWSLVSKSGSSPVNSIAYGMPIEGMEPSAISSADAEPLEPGVEYRLLIQAKSIRGTNNFSVPAKSASR